MRLPSRVRLAAERVLGAPISDVQRVSGGSINEAATVSGGGQRVFMKWNLGAPAGFFQAEVDGLARLRAAGLRVPECLACDEDDQPGVLALRHVEASPRSASMADAGRALAHLHAQRGHRPGLERPNFIGRLPQANGRERDVDEGWVSFFRTHRVEALASVLPASVRAQLDRVDFARILTEPTGGCALLHGDLWAGNLIEGVDDHAWFVDPAVYYGHPEVDLAMTRLFGGFDEAFYQAYQDVAGRFDAGLDARLDVLNLYPLLVHAHLFGGGYIAQAAAVVRRFA